MATNLYSNRVQAFGNDFVGKAGETLAAGNILYVSGIDGGVPVYSIALATSANKVNGLLYYFVGRMAGGVAVLGDYIRVAANTHLTGITGVPAVNDYAFVSDTGMIALTAGTNSRKIGRAFYAAGGLYGISFDGAFFGAASDPTGTPNTFTKYNNSGILAPSNVTEDNTTLVAQFGRGQAMTTGPLLWPGTELTKAAGENHNVAASNYSIEMRLSGGAGAARTITLPGAWDTGGGVYPAPALGRVVFFSDADGQAAVNNITIIGKVGANGFQIEGADTMAVTAAYSAGMLVFMRDRWKILANRQT